ncbi:MAG TPA: hypothetical protein VFB73_14570 [Chloroflexota bacterium]|jgi:hypothetical protein|nr:hypothetical protein [Chloroflexota bacterium]
MPQSSAAPVYRPGICGIISCIIGIMGIMLWPSIMPCIIDIMRIMAVHCSIICCIGWDDGGWSGAVPGAGP